MKEKNNKVNYLPQWNYRKEIVLLSFSLLFFFSLKINIFAQQDPQYSQYMFNQLAINPAYAGAKEAISTTMFYRDQWGFDGAPKTGSLTVHSPMRKRKVALGFAFTNDRIGPKNTNGILGSYAYRIKLGKGKLSMGLRLGIYQYKYSYGEHDFEEANDQFNAPSTVITYTADAGVYYYTNTTYAGLSMTHLDRGHLQKPIGSTIDSSRLEYHVFLTGGKAWELSEKLIFNPSFMLKAVKNSPPTADINLSFLLQQRLWLGISARIKYGIVAYTQFYINNKFKIGYAYDFGINKPARQLGSTHEIMLSYDFSMSKPPFVSPRYF